MNYEIFLSVLISLICNYYYHLGTVGRCDQVFFSMFFTGEFQMSNHNKNITPLDPKSVASVVRYGTLRNPLNHEAKGYSLVYSQLYPFEGLQNYTSGIIHHVRLTGRYIICYSIGETWCKLLFNSLLLFLFVFTGLKPDKLYYYRCGDPSIGALSDVYSFKTMPVSSPRSYPKRIAVMGDLGLTYNTSTTISHVISNKPQLALLVGDVTYANLYLTNGTGCDCYSCSFPNSPIHETYQPRWDYWGRYACSLISLLLQSASGDCIVNVLICKFLQVHAAFSF
jgi:hypothetical protein